MLTRELAVHYGGVIIGGGSQSYRLDGYYRSEIGYERSFVEFDFVVTASSHPEFVALVKAVEDEFRKPNGRLRVTIHNSIVVDLSHETSTGFNARPSISKSGGKKDTARSRSYRVRIDFDMPADTGEEVSSGLRESTVDLSYSPSRRRTVTFAGLYTALGSADARDVYEANADSYCDDILSGFGGTYELVEEPLVEADAQDKQCRWRRVYEEVVFGQGAGSTDDAAIVRQDLRIQRRRMAPGDTLNTYGGDAGGPAPGGSAGTSTAQPTNRLVEVVANYDAWIRSDQTTDLVGKYDSTIKPWILQQVESLVEGKKALVDEQVEPQYDDNRISAVLTFHVQAGGDAAPLEREVSIEDTQESGETLVGVWSGNPLEKYKYQRPTRLRRTVTLRLVIPGVKGPGYAAAMGFDAADAANANAPVLRPGDTGGTTWAEVTRTSRSVPKVRGLDGETLETTEIHASVTRELYKPRQSSGGNAVTHGGRPAGAVTG